MLILLYLYGDVAGGKVAGRNVEHEGNEEVRFVIYRSMGRRVDAVFQLLLG